MARKQDIAGEDNWVRAAMLDDSVVAEILTLFRQPKQSFSSHGPLKWKVKQPRSRGILRASPSTPLSWSSKESSPVQLQPNKRSQVSTAAEVNINKRSRKKKTLAELKDEEIFLVKERKNLKMKLAVLSVNLENHRVVNERLKRYKIDLLNQPLLQRTLVSDSIESIPIQLQLQNASFTRSNSLVLPEDIRNEALDKLPSKAEDASDKFVLPDLNLPLDEHYNTEVL